MIFGQKMYWILTEKVFYPISYLMHFQPKSRKIEENRRKTMKSEENRAESMIIEWKGYLKTRIIDQNRGT